MNDWLQSIYTIFDRIGNFFNTAYHAIVNGISYVSSSVSGILGASGLPSEVLTVLGVAIALCIILLILGR